MTIQFTKMQGLGNDFAVIDAVSHSVKITPDLVREMADRHFGIGFDQLLLVEPPNHAGIDFTYRIFNTDGQEVGQCGNGARCVGKFVLESGLTTKKNIRFGTLERDLEVHLQDNGQIAVNMGVPNFEPKDIPFDAPRYADSYQINVNGEQVELAAVNLGNPHAVLIYDNIKQGQLERLGKKLECHPRFPERVNVGFMQCVDRGHIYLRVYERGVGETLACGSGACAAVVIGRVKNLLDAEVRVEVPGGELKVQWLGKNNPVWLIGAAEIVFRGEWLKRS